MLTPGKTAADPYASTRSAYFTTPPGAGPSMRASPCNSYESSLPTAVKSTKWSGFGMLGQCWAYVRRTGPLLLEPARGIILISPGARSNVSARTHFCMSLSGRYLFYDIVGSSNVRSNNNHDNVLQ